MNLTLSDIERLVAIAEKSKVRHLKFQEFAVEFFETKPELMNLDPAALSKTFAESMPPDSAMLFASTEDPAPETQNPIQKQLETNEMA